MLAAIWKSLRFRHIAFCARRNTWTKPQSVNIFKLRAIGRVRSCFLSRPRPASARPTGNSLWRGQTVMPPHGKSGHPTASGPFKSRSKVYSWTSHAAPLWLRPHLYPPPTASLLPPQWMTVPSGRRCRTQCLFLRFLVILCPPFHPTYQFPS